MMIQSNGSKWAGQEPDSMDVLLDTLKTDILDPVFEQYGGFFSHLGNGEFRAFGNFSTVSHVFSITGTLEELRPLAKALAVARRRPEYLIEKARAEKCARDPWSGWFVKSKRKEQGQ